MESVGKFTIEVTRYETGLKVTKKSENIDFHTLLGALTMSVDEIKERISEGNNRDENGSTLELEKEMD